MASDATQSNILADGLSQAPSNAVAVEVNTNTTADPDENLGSVIDAEVEDHRQRYSGLMTSLEEIDRLYKGMTAYPGEQYDVAGDKSTARRRQPKTIVEHGSLELHGQIEDQIAAEHAMTFADTPYMEPYRTGMSDDEMALAWRVKANMERQHFEGGFKHISNNVRRWCRLYGTAIMKVGWESERFLVEKPEGWVAEEGYEGPTWKNVPIWRFHWTDDGNTIQKVSRVTEEIELTEEQVRNLIDAAKHYAQLKDEEAVLQNIAPGQHGIKWREWDTIKTTAGDAYLNTTAQKLRQESGRGDTVNPPFTGYLTWGIHPTLKSTTRPDRPDERSWYVISVRGLGWIAQMPTPYKHKHKGGYIKATMIHEDETFTGWGTGTLTRLSQMAINKRILLIDKAISLSVFGMYQRRNAPDNKAAAPIKASPGATFDEMTDGTLTPLPINTSGISPAIQMNQLEAFGSRAATGGGVAEAGSPGKKSTKEMQSIAITASRRTQQNAEMFADDMIRPAFEVQHSLTGQFSGPKFSFEWFDRNGRMVQNEFDGNYPMGKYRWIIKLALDLDNRPKLIRSLKETQMTNVQLLSMFKDSPLMPLALAAFLPGILQNTRKLALLNGQNPDESLDPMMVKMILQAVSPQAMLPPPGAPINQQTLMALMANQGQPAGAPA